MLLQRYEYTSPVSGETYDLRVEWAAVWSNDETNIQQARCVVTNRTTNLVVYDHGEAVYAADPDDLDSLVEYLTWRTPVPVFPPDKEMLATRLAAAQAAYTDAEHAHAATEAALVPYAARVMMEQQNTGLTIQEALAQLSQRLATYHSQRHILRLQKAEYDLWLKNAARLSTS